MSETLLIQTLETAVAQMEQIPLWGNPPPFHWEEFSKKAGSMLNAPNLKIRHKQTSWQDGKHTLSGLGTHPLITPIDLSPLPSPFFWILSEDSQKLLIRLFFSENQEIGKGIQDPIFEEGLAHYLYLQLLEIFNTIAPFGSLRVGIGAETHLPKEGALSIDIEISSPEGSLWGRLLCGQDAVANFRSFFAMEKPPLISDPSLSNIPLSLSLEVGATTLTAQEWEEVEEGDFLLLEKCTYNIDSQKGTGRLAVAGNPLFDMRIKGEEAKILEYALIKEEISMKEKPPHQNKHPLPPLDRKSPQEAISQEERGTRAAANGEGQTPNLPSGKIPIQITVEMDRFQMPLEKVTQLKPGNVLQLGLSPAAHVHLTIEGKRVAKGELVRLGETLGVKILTTGG